MERFELGKMRNLLFSHPEGTNDNRFWALTLAVYAAEQAPMTKSAPKAPIFNRSGKRTFKAASVL